MNANTYNLSNIKPEEYTTYNQRKDFFAWIDAQLKSKGHEVVWPSMAYFICNKFHLLESFPYNMLTNRKMKDHAKAGSEVVFKNSFEILKQLYDSDTILKNEKALEWDKQVLHDEQFVWIQSVYETMDEQSTKRIEKIAKGRGIYSLFVPKAIRFEGDISNPTDRYEYAFEKLRDYCRSLN